MIPVVRTVHLQNAVDVEAKVDYSAISKAWRGCGIMFNTGGIGSVYNALRRDQAEYQSLDAAIPIRYIV